MNKVKGGGIVILVAVVVGILAALLVFNWDSTDVDEVGLTYSAGPIEGRHFQDLTPPGSSIQFLGILDYMVKLPANQRTYIVSEDGGGDVAGGKLITATDSEGVAISFATSATFELPTNADTLDKFYTDICTKYDDCYDEDGTNDDGWGLMLNDYFRKAQEAALRQEARRYTVDQLMKEDLTEFGQEVAAATEAKVESQMGGKYFEDITFQIQRPIPPASVQDRFNAAKAAELQTQVKAEEVKQAEQQANAAEELAETLENNPNYLELRKIEVQEKAVEEGRVEFWILPEGQDVDVNK